MFLAQKLKNMHISTCFRSIYNSTNSTNFVQFLWDSDQISLKLSEELSKVENMCVHFDKNTEKRNFAKKSETGAVQRNVNFVGLEKCCKMSIYLQRSVLIQRRTSDLILIILLASRDLIFDRPVAPRFITILS